MEALFSILTVEQWLTILRIGIGLWWLMSFLHKPHQKLVSGQMVNWTVAMAYNHPIPADGSTFKGLVHPNASWFPYLVLIAELAAPVGIILGFLTLLALMVVLLLNLNFISLAGVKTKDISVYACYQCEQGKTGQ